jgi:hypothetical protein
MKYAHYKTPVLSAIKQEVRSAFKNTTVFPQHFHPYVSSRCAIRVRNCTSPNNTKSQTSNKDNVVQHALSSFLLFILSTVTMGDCINGENVLNKL